MPTESEIIKKSARPQRKLTANLLSDEGARWFKILGFGLTGTGKTLAIKGFLESGLKVFAVSSDIGGNGFSSLLEDLKANGKQDLANQFSYYECRSYDDWEAWLLHPEIMEVEGKGFWEWNPDVLVWDGFANWQERHLSDKILRAGPLVGDDKTAHPLYEEGLAMDRPGFGALRKRTLRDLDSFLTIHNPNSKKIHKYVTCLQNDGSKDDAFSGESKVGPLVIGAAYSYMGPAFDLVLQTTTKTKLVDGKKQLEYLYKCDLSGGALAKKRGLPVESVEPADMAALWKKITGKSEVKAA